jgi:3'(2'), 5'-bisphosphate nucleotidase
MTPPTDDLCRELRLARRLAHDAGRLVMRYRTTDLEVAFKHHHGPVTLADRRASEHIVNGLCAAYEADIVVSEELPDDPRRLHAPRVWYVDPIDGTDAFIRGDDGFCVMVGLCVDHRPRLGVIYAPAVDHVFWGVAGAGAWSQQAEGPVSRLACSDVFDLAGVLCQSRRVHADAGVKAFLGIGDRNVASVGLRLALVAMGIADLHVVSPSAPPSHWDTCAPSVILAEAGGRVTDAYGEPLRYDLDVTTHSRGLVASNGWIHDAAVKRLSVLFSAPML